jgi:hypothetical protein
MGDDDYPLRGINIIITLQLQFIRVMMGDDG